MLKVKDIVVRNKDDWPYGTQDHYKGEPSTGEIVKVKKEEPFIYRVKWKNGDTNAYEKTSVKLFNSDSSEVLPDKWCVKVTKENIAALGRWRTIKSIPSTYIGQYCSNLYKEIKGYVHLSQPDGYVVLSYDNVKHIVEPKEKDSVTTNISDRNTIIFPIGTKLKTLTDSPNGGNVRKGSVATIYEVTDKHFVLDFPEQSDYYVPIDFFKDRYGVENFSLPTTIASSPTLLKIGDSFEALVNRPNSGGVMKGSVGVIKEIGTYDYVVDFPEQSHYSVPKEFSLTSYKVLKKGTKKERDYPVTPLEAYLVVTPNYLQTEQYTPNLAGVSIARTKINKHLKF